MIKLADILLMEKIKGIDGKACWKGYRYAGTKDGKDKCVPMNKEEIDMSVNEVLQRFRLGLGNS